MRIIEVFSLKFWNKFELKRSSGLINLLHKFDKEIYWVIERPNTDTIDFNAYIEAYRTAKSCEVDKFSTIVGIISDQFEG